MDGQQPTRRRRWPRPARRATTPGTAARRPPRPGLVGGPAVAVSGRDPTGIATSRDWDDGSPALVAFLTSGCSTCQRWWATLADPAGFVAGLPVLVVTPSPATESRRAVAARAAPGLAVMMSSDAWVAYGVRGAPWFVVVSGGTVRAEGTATTRAELLALVGDAAPPGVA